jgi:RNA polymerase sigma-70 factor, ECF subfamily
MLFGAVEEIEVNPMANDAALVAAAKAGDARAFEILVRRYQRRIHAVALRFTRVREDAEDVVQQSFQKAFVHLCKFEGKSSFSTWLTRIAINEGLMLLRKRRGLREIAIDDSSETEDSDLGSEIPDSATSPENRYLQQEQRRILFAAIMQLNPRTRRAVALRELGELSTEETARALGLSVSAVKTRVFHARRKLREALRLYFESAWNVRKPSVANESQREGQCVHAM